MNTVNDTAIAAHRFGLGEPDLKVVGNDPKAWLIGQIGPADPQVGVALASALEGLRTKPDMQRRGFKSGMARPEVPETARNEALRADMHGGKVRKVAKLKGGFDKTNALEALKDIMAQDVYARLVTATASQRPFAERLAMFWSNHFTVSEAKSKVRGLVGAFEREAIRPNIAGKFETMLVASTTHPAMLLYLDNQSSVGPNSPAVLRAAPGEKLDKKSRGLNENLAREVLELHTLGAESSRHPANAAAGYQQADVTELARILTGWTVPTLPDAQTAVVFEARRHEPGAKTVLGVGYPEGQQALPQVLRDLARHPATGHFLATKLARHFVADDPPPALVQRMAAAYRASGGELSAMYRELINAPESWQPALAKLKTPEEFAVSSARLLGLGDAWVSRQRDGGIESMGQKLLWAASPAGWSDLGDDWLGPDAVWKRIEWSTRLAERLGAQVDARAIARSSLGPLLSAQTAQQVERAADGSQALALLLMSPEFQRR